MNEEKELPEGWVRTTLEYTVDICDNLRQPVNAEERSRRSGPYPYYGATGQVGWIDNYLMDGEFILLGEDGAPFLELFKPKAYLVSGKCWVNNHAHVLQGIEDISNNRFLMYLLNTIDYHDFVSGTTRLKLTQLAMKQLPIVFPPFPEQQRIVSAIEERFTILDAVTIALQQNKQKLKLARASVLKYAVEGKLTEKWRAEHPVTESGSQLLERILAERRAKWEAEQVAKGKDPRKLRYEEPARPDVSELPDLPEGWCWATVDQLITYLRNGLSDKPNTEPPGHRILRINAVRPMTVDMDEVRFLNLPEKNIEAYFIEDGDILFTRYNGSLDLLGVAGMVRGCIQPTLHPDKLIRVKVQLNGIDPSYVQLASNVGFSRTHIESRARTTAGQTGISGSDLKQMPIPLPSTIEQHQIVAEVERRLSVIEQAQVAIETSLKRIERARQSILEQAFSGRLVPQDPHDEPASMLLERIQEERARRIADGKQRGRNGGVKAARSRKTQEQEFVPQWQLLQDAKQLASMDGSLSSVSAHEDGALERCEMDREELGELVQMRLLSLWD